MKKIDIIVLVSGLVSLFLSVVFIFLALMNFTGTLAREVTNADFNDAVETAKEKIEEVFEEQHLGSNQWFK